MLDHAIAQYAGQGWAVESRTPNQAVLAKKKKIGWFWNILLTFFTGGLWLVVVFFKVVNRKTNRIVLTVDPAGNVIHG